MVRRRGLGGAAGEDAPVHGHEVRHEADPGRVAGGKRQLLLDLGDVFVPGHRVGRKVLVGRAEVEALSPGPAGAGDARLGVDVDPFGSISPADSRGKSASSAAVE